MRQANSLILFISILFSATQPSKADNEPPNVAVRLRGRVESVTVSADKSFDTISVKVALELENTGKESIIFLSTGLPAYIGAQLARKPTDFTTGDQLTSTYGIEPFEFPPGWRQIENQLISSTGPVAFTDTLRPTEKRTLRATAILIASRRPGINEYPRRASLDEIRSADALWIRVIYCTWPAWGLGLPTDDSSLGHQLRNRWRSIGYLWVEDILSEPIPLRIK
jgi:hypothetical protein